MVDNILVSSSEKIITYLECVKLLSKEEDLNGEIISVTDERVSILVESRDIDKIKFPAGVAMFRFYDKRIVTHKDYVGNDVSFRSCKFNKSSNYLVGTNMNVEEYAAHKVAGFDTKESRDYFYNREIDWCEKEGIVSAVDTSVGFIFAREGEIVLSPDQLNYAPPEDAQ